MKTVISQGFWQKLKNTTRDFRAGWELQPELDRAKKYNRPYQQQLRQRERQLRDIAYPYSNRKTKIRNFVINPNVELSQEQIDQINRFVSESARNAKMLEQMGFGRVED